MISIDFLLDETGDLITDDLVLGESDNQHIQLLFITEQGHWKENPITGIGIEKQINGDMDGSFRRNVNIQLEADGYLVANFSIDDSNINVDAVRKG